MSRRSMPLLLQTLHSNIALTGGVRRASNIMSFSQMMDGLHNKRIKSNAQLSPSERFGKLKSLAKQRVKLAPFSKTSPVLGGQPTLHFSDVTEVAAKIAKAADGVGIDTVVGGSIALMLYMPPRMTGDIDMNMRVAATGEPLTKEMVENLVGKIPGAKFVSFYTLRAKGHDHLSMNIGQIYVDDVPVDIFSNVSWPLSPKLFDEPVILHTGGLRFASPEVCLTFKMMAYDPDARRFPKDLADIRSALDALPDLDVNWVKDRLEEWDATGAKAARWMEEWDMAEANRNRDKPQDL